MVLLCSFQESKLCYESNQTEKLEMPKWHHNHSPSLLKWKSWLIVNSSNCSLASKKVHGFLTTLIAAHQFRILLPPTLTDFTRLAATVACFLVLVAVVLKELPAGVCSNYSFVHKSHRQITAIYEFTEDCQHIFANITERKYHPCFGS